MIDMKKNETHQELIIKSSFPALQVPEKDLSAQVAMEMLAQAATEALAASYSIPGN